MDKYTIVVMDYESEDPEAWLGEHDKNWSDTSCYWMGVKGHDVNEDHIYGADYMKEVESCLK